MPQVKVEVEKPVGGLKLMGNQIIMSNRHHKSWLLRVMAQIYSTPK